MIFEKNKMKTYVLWMAIFLVGMLSVSISNIFGGYYCSVAAIEVVLLTLAIYNFFDKKQTNKFNFISLSLCGLITLFGVVFFIVNDVFKVDIYVKNSFNFWSIIVLISQLSSIVSMVYTSIVFVLDANKDKVEVVNEAVINENLEVVTETTENEEEKENGKNIEMKYLAQENVDVEAPFMEQEI